MKKLLVVGAGFEQLPPIIIGKEMGLEVHVIDKNPNAPGFQHADQYAVISTTDYDKALGYVEKENIDGLMTVASETAIPTIARITEKLGLPGMSYDTSIAATNKNYMREKVSNEGVTVPKSMAISDYESAEDFISSTTGPWVLKPSDNSAQRGITFFNENESLEKAYQEAKKYTSDGKLIFEQFIEGPEINVCAIVKDGAPIYLSLADRVTDPYNNFGIAVRHLYPSCLEPHQEQEVRDLCTKAIKGIGLENGIAYPQIIYGKTGPVFIEIAARMPGGNNREIALYASGIDMVEAAINQALDLPYDEESLRKDQIYDAAYVRFITHNDFNQQYSTFATVDGLEEANAVPGVMMTYFNLKAGDPIPRLIHSGDRFGAIITTGISRDEVVRIAENAFQKLTFRYKK